MNVRFGMQTLFEIHLCHYLQAIKIVFTSMNVEFACKLWDFLPLLKVNIFQCCIKVFNSKLKYKIWVSHPARVLSPALSTWSVSFFTDLFRQTSIMLVVIWKNWTILAPLISKLSKSDDPSLQSLADFLEVHFLHVQFSCFRHELSQLLIRLLQSFARCVEIFKANFY